MTSCSYFPQCKGCSQWHTSYVDQQRLKISTLRELLAANSLAFTGEIEFISCGEYGLRDRMDFTFHFDEKMGRHKFGFYDHDRQLLDIEKCLQITPQLQHLFAEFRNFRFWAAESPLMRGSVRLRTGIRGQKGCWLDLANVDIKKLLDDGQLLNSLLNAGFNVEIGQKGKRVVSTPAGLKLSSPAPEDWFESFGPDGHPMPLAGLISDFTQPSRLTAKALVFAVLDWLLPKSHSQMQILEFGPGLGQFTLAFLKSGMRVTALEIHEQAALQMQRNVEKLGLSHLLNVHIGDYHRKSAPGNSTHQFAFVNPARSGLKAFAHELIKIHPEHIIYVSCFPESMAADLKILSAEYEIMDLKIVDQFPQTEHFESLALLEKIKLKSKS